MKLGELIAKARAIVTPGNTLDAIKGMSPAQLAEVQPLVSGVSDDANQALSAGSDGKPFLDVADLGTGGGVGGLTQSQVDARVAVGVSSHTAAADPHPGYLTPAEADAAYAGLSAAQQIGYAYNAVTRVLTLTRYGGETVTIDLSALAVDVSVSGASLSNGVLTLAQDEGGAPVTVDLNAFALDVDVASSITAAISAAAGNYAAAGHTHALLMTQGERDKLASLTQAGSSSLLAESVPATPASGLAPYAPVVAGGPMLGVIDALGASSVFGNHLGTTRYSLWMPSGGGAATAPASHSSGSVAPTAAGTAAARNISAANALSRARRIGYGSAPTAGSFGGVYWTSSGPAYVYLGDGGLGGFLWSWTFGCSDGAPVSGRRMFVGLSSNASPPTNVEPSTLVNAIGVAQLSTSNNLCIVRGGSAPQTPIDLGASFPAADTGSLYRLILRAHPLRPGWIGYTVQRYTDSVAPAASVSGAITETTPGVDLPSPTTGLLTRAWCCNNATALAASIDLGALVIEDSL